MTKRPLCMTCLIFLIIRSILFMITSGENLVKLPAASIFSESLGTGEVIIEGQLYKKANTSKIQILHLKNNSLVQENKSFQESNILIYDDTFSEIPIGKKVRVKGKITKFEQARNPGNFNQQLYYAKQNMYGFVWSEKILSVTGKENKLMEALYQFRQVWKTNLQNNMSEENGKVLSAMLLGEKSEMDIDLKEQYQKAGISHVLAISGLHISFIGLGIYRLLRKAGASYMWAGTISALALGGYTLMIGFSVSVFRSYVMLLLRIGADITGRVYDMLTAVMLSAVMLVAYQPLYLTEAAFYLSHGAILGLVLILPKIKDCLPNRKWVEGVFAGVAVNLATFPIILWFYFEISFYSLIINMVVIPLMTWVLGLGMFGSILCFLWEPLGELLLGGCNILLTVFERLSVVCCGLPYAQLTFGKPNWWEVVIYYAVLMVVLSWKRNKKQIVAIRLFGIAIAMMIFIKFPSGTVQITMLDVGQGDCIFMRGPQGNTYLIDGGSSDVKELAKYRIEPFLKSQGSGSLDYVFVSHGDADHYSGVREMLGRQKTGVKIQKLVLPANYRQDEELKNLASEALGQGVQVAVIKEGQVLREGDLRIQCLQPSEHGTIQMGNAASMVLDVSYKSFDMLFTGDVEKEGEEQLLSNLPSKQYDILKVAHHGSKNSTGEDLLKKTKPKIAWISAGEENSYGHPHKETLDRLQKYGCKICQTMKYGAITVESDGDFIDIFPSSI